VIEPTRPAAFRILGPLQVRAGGRWAGISAAKWRSLLAVLLLSPGQPVSTERLISEIWEDRPPARAANLVSVYVHRLRRLLGDPEGEALVTRPPGYQLTVAPGALDAQQFTDLTAAGRHALAAGDADRAAGLLAAALAHWRGPALADVPPSPLVSAEASRLEEARIETLSLRIEADLACGRAGAVIGELRRLLADHPLREELWALLMRALHAAGRQAEALAEYARAREIISGELGVDPGPGLQRLHAQLLDADAARAAGLSAGGRAFPGPAGGTTVPGSAGVAAGTGPAERPAGGGSAGGGTPAHPDAGVSPDRAGQGLVSQPSPRTPVPGLGHPGLGHAGEAGPGQAGPGHAGEAGPGKAGPGRPGLGHAGRMLVPAQLPADIPDFTGRAGEVAEVCRLLSGEEQPGNPGAVPVVCVVGSGGLGKTTLAVHAAHRLAAEFPDGQLYASLLGATQPARPADVLARFLRDLGTGPGQIPAGEEERAAQYRSRLAGRRVLVVLDDARDAAQVRPLLPGSASCAVLITSRGRLPELVGTRVIDLDVLPGDDARTLFARVAGEERTSAEPAATQEVLAACAGLPLAIRIAGARLAARGGWNVHYLAGRLADERRRLDELRAGNLAVRASFEVSFASLAGSAGPGEVDPARAFRLLGIWTGPSVPLPAAAALLGADEAATAAALEVLVDAHLLDEPAPGQFRFHDLLRVYAADRARAQESESDRHDAIIRVLIWYLHTAEAAAAVISPQHARVPLGALPEGVVPLEFGSLEDALAWCEAQRPGLVAAVRLAGACGLDELAWKLAASQMSFFYRRSHWADWVTTHETGLAAARRLADRPAEAWMLNNLGMAYGVQRREEAVDCFGQALALYREVGDRQGEGRAANNVAKACLDLGRFPQALEAAQQALAIQRQAGSRYLEGIALNILGCASRELGRYEPAASYLQQALAIFRELGDPLVEADSLSDLGEVYLDTGRLEEALACLQDSAGMWRAIGNRHGEAATLARLGTALRLAGEPEQAGEALARALALFEELGDLAQAAVVRAALAGGASQAC
jgi:DNA-binding SARP family transcriptional activator